MKKSIFVVWILVCFMFASCTESFDTSSDVANESVVSEKVHIGINEVDLQYVNSYASARYIPKTNSAKDITEEDCEELAYDVYDEIFCIVKEFYGQPEYLKVTPGAYPVGEIPYTEVYVNPSPEKKYPIEFENNAESIKSTLDKYFTDSFIELAFNLKHPCPIYEENGTLFRTEYETNTAYAGCDISAGRILSRENGVVRYAFPIYFIDYEIHEPDTEFWKLGYIDFSYEDGMWKVNDLRLSSVFYSIDEFPGGKADVGMDDFVKLGDEAQHDGIIVNLVNGNEVSVSVNGKRISEKLSINTSKIRNIEVNDANIFVSFLGAFGKTETLVISEKEVTLISKFVSDGYCITANGDWFYTKIDRQACRGEVFDKNGTAVSGYTLVRQDSAEYRGLPEIAPIEKIEYVDGQLNIVYDVSAY